MVGFVNDIKLKEIADEDIYFARRDKELIEAMHQKRLAEAVECPEPKQEKTAKSFQKKFRKVTSKHEGHPKRLARSYRRLLDQILEMCTHRQDAGVDDAGVDKEVVGKEGVGKEVVGKEVVGKEVVGKEVVDKEGDSGKV